MKRKYLLTQILIVGEYQFIFPFLYSWNASCEKKHYFNLKHCFIVQKFCGHVFKGICSGICIIREKFELEDHQKEIHCFRLG